MLIFADPKNPKLGEYGTIGSFVINIVDQIIVNLLKNNCPYEDDPDLCSKIYFTGRDVGMILQKFRILSTMNCTKEPVMDWSDPDAGAIISKGDCTENWHTVVFSGRWARTATRPTWNAGPNTSRCRPFRHRKGDQRRDQRQDHRGQYLHIDQHAVNLKYGALINFALEKILLPQVSATVPTDFRGRYVRKTCRIPACRTPVLKNHVVLRGLRRDTYTEIHLAAGRAGGRGLRGSSGHCCRLHQGSVEPA